MHLTARHNKLLAMSDGFIVILKKHTAEREGLF